MKINDILDVFGTESVVETTMTPEQEYEASVESLINEIDSTLEVRAGLEALEESTMEYAQASCESLLAGLAVREMEIANEDVDFANLCASLNINPEMFGFEAIDKEALKEKVKAKTEKAKELAGKVKNSRVASAIKAIKEKVIKFILSFFTVAGAVESGLKKIVKLAKSEKVKENAKDQMVAAPKVVKFGKSIAAAKSVNEAIEQERWGAVAGKVDALVAELTEAQEEKEVAASEFVDKVSSLFTTVDVTRQAILIDNAKTKLKNAEIDPKVAKELLAALSKAIKAMKNGFKAAASHDIKVLKSLAKVKKAEATESVEFGVESITEIFGEIKRVEAGIESEELPEEYKGMESEEIEIYEMFAAVESTMEAMEDVADMLVEATIPSQIAALECLAIEKGITGEAGLGFDLFGNMSAGTEAADEVVENAPEETKKSVKEKVKGAASKISRSVSAAYTFAVNKLQGFKMVPRALKAMSKKIDKMSAEDFAEYMKSVGADVNNILTAVYAANALATALKNPGTEPEAMKEFKFDENSTKEEVLAAFEEAIKVAKAMKLPKAMYKDMKALMKHGESLKLVAKLRKFASTVGSKVKAGLVGCKNALKKLVPGKKAAAVEPEVAPEA